MTSANLPASGAPVASAEELRELALSQYQQLELLRREVGDANYVIDALRAILDEDDAAEPFTKVFTIIAPLFKYQHALVLVEDDESAATIHCVVASDPRLVGTAWPRAPLIDKALAGRVIATVRQAENPATCPVGAEPGILDPAQPVLYVPLGFRGQRGLMMLRRAADVEGFDRRDVAVARKLSLLASQALATRQANRAEQERRRLRSLTDELRQARDHLEYQANHDELTGLASRSFIHEQAELAIANLAEGEEIGLAFIDLDGFKQVNDYYGHDVGDELLRAVADRLRAYAFDDTDVVARVSGDEFMILINPVHSQERVVDLGMAGLAEMRRPFELGPLRLMISASVGFAFYPDHGSSFAELRRNADLAMYRAKSDSRGSVVVYEPGMDADVAARIDQEQELRRAIAEGRFRAVLQPKVSARTLAVGGFEVLARQVDETGRIGQSAAFIELAGQVGLLDEITELVIADAVTRVRELRAAYGDEVTFSFNISTRQATDPRRLAAIIEQLRSAGDPSWFIVEVTEDALLELDTYREQIAPVLDDAGLRVSIDDFGTGFASLSRLLVANADEIKIDRSFIGSIHQRPRGQVFLEAMVMMGGEIGASVVVEGVETVDELRYLVADEAIEQLQGYLLGRPQPVEYWLDNRHEVAARLAGLAAAMRDDAGLTGGVIPV